ncbi:hypothetical protein EGR_07624 [Echinococcus granulosus]|uniref:Uncharacterized protein n=1 Tax=Echinococcus granulosus TaxID=6210 RepID=W6U8H3_ECHGR|nr:hypothetical protein EGR_07624 [Echinococcus granulosus]EUB57533.1 hypothetical protein EGR_07624 [Echinococcus granulosus]
MAGDTDNLSEEAHVCGINYAGNVQALAEVAVSAATDSVFWGLTSWQRLAHRIIDFLRLQSADQFKRLTAIDFSPLNQLIPASDIS